MVLLSYHTPHRPATKYATCRFLSTFFMSWSSMYWYDWNQSIPMANAFFRTKNKIRASSSSKRALPRILTQSYVSQCMLYLQWYLQAVADLFCCREYQIIDDHLSRRTSWNLINLVLINLINLINLILVNIYGIVVSCVCDHIIYIMVDHTTTTWTTM